MAKRVIVIHDERHIGRLVEVNLTRQGYAVTLSSSADDAVTILASETFDLAVLGPRLGSVNSLLEDKGIPVHQV